MLERMVARKCVCLRRLADGQRRDIVRFDRFLHNPRVTMDALIEGWGEQTREACADRHVLAIQDASDIHFRTTPEQRRDTMYGQVESWWHGYEDKVFKPVDSMDDLWDVPRAWELRRQYTGALKDIGLALRHAPLVDEADDLV